MTTSFAAREEASAIGRDVRTIEPLGGTHKRLPNNTNLDMNNNDDDDVTIIFLETESDMEQQQQRRQRQQLLLNDDDLNNINVSSPLWFERIMRTNDIINPDGRSTMEEYRRQILLVELKRRQRISCIQFTIMCSIPLLLFVIMVILVTQDSVPCTSTITKCILQPRSFTNAYTTRCICDPIPVERNITSFLP